MFYLEYFLSGIFLLKTCYNIIQYVLQIYLINICIQMLYTNVYNICITYNIIV